MALNPIILLITIISTSRGFLHVSHARNRHLRLESGRGDENLSMDDLEMEQFRRRKEILERKALQNHLRRPPNPFLGPVEVVVRLLEELRRPTSPYSGVTALLETANEAWREMLRKSVGAPKEATNAQLAPPLEAALGRPNQQFAILLGIENSDYQPTFPTDPLDYGDTCWVECRLRGAIDDELLVAMGW